MLKLFKAGFWLVVWWDVFIIHQLDFFFLKVIPTVIINVITLLFLKSIMIFFIVCVALTCSRKLNIIMTWTIIICIIKLTRQRRRKCCDKLQRSVRRGEEGILGLRGSALRTWHGDGAVCLLHVEFWWSSVVYCFQTDGLQFDLYNV